MGLPMEYAEELNRLVLEMKDLLVRNKLTSA